MAISRNEAPVLGKKTDNVIILKPACARLSLAIAFLFLSLMRIASAAESSALNVDAINTRLQEIEAASELEEGTRSKLVELYRKSLAYLETARADGEKAKSFAHLRGTAASQAEKIRRQTEDMAGTAPWKAAAGGAAHMPVAELEKLLVTERANLSIREGRLAELEEALTQEAERPVAIRNRLTEAVLRQEQISAELGYQPPSNENSAMTEARRWLLEAELLALRAEIRMLNEELSSQPMRVALLEAQREQATKTTDSIRAGINQLDAEVGKRRRLEADAAKAHADAAERAALGTHPLVQKLAAENTALSKQNAALAGELERVSRDQDVAAKEAKRLTDDFHDTQRKLEIAGLSPALGQLLLERQRALPDLRGFGKESRERKALIAEATLAQMRFDEERANLRDLDAYIANLVAGLPRAEVDENSVRLRRLAADRRELLNRGTETNNAYLRALAELDFARKQLFDAAKAYKDLLAERLLWIRTDPVVDLAALREVPAEISSAISSAQWRAVGDALVERSTASPALLLAAAAAGLLVWKRRRFRTVLRDAGKTIGRPSTDRFSFTLRALWFSMLLAAPWPLLTAAVGWQLGEALGPTPFTKAVSAALLQVSFVLFHLLGFAALCEPGGLAAVHFRWPEASLARLRQELLRLTILLPPAAFVAWLFAAEDTWSLHRGISRIALLIVLITLAAFLYRVVKGVLAPVMSQHPGGSLARLRLLWLGLSIGVPAALAGLILYGYDYTSGELTARAARTMWFVFGLVLIHQLAVRWLSLTQRRLKFEATLERRRAALAARDAASAVQADSGEFPDEIPEEVEEPQIDLVAVSKESRELLTMALVIAGIAGVWLIWSEVLPALGVLGDVSLWHQLKVVEGREIPVPTTLADIGLAMLVLLVTLLAAKRFPAVLEIVVLQHVGMISGARYAIKTLSRYLIVGIGSLLAFSSIGLDWSKLQWLVAALGVGIGFGLQEIVANFISGLIILFERPIRVGDVVTIGDTDGTVTRIRIRATTILNWDRKELLVPNKEFITGRLLNWSLTDQTTRIVISLGVAYGSDVQKAMALLAEAAAENEHVLEDPKPFVTFDGFGDNALGLTLRAYVGSLDHRIGTLSQLNQAINRKLNEAGIVIAFPQRDVHLTSSQPLAIRIMPDEPCGEAGAQGGQHK
jgi:potassium-dependent mechanosensitive channel